MIQKIKDKIQSIMNNQNVSDETGKQKTDEVINSINKLTSTWTLSKRTIFRNFVLGIASALGATVGLAIILAILGVIIRAVGGLPVVGEMFLKLGSYLDK
jgi:hypothetical protein